MHILKSISLTIVVTSFAFFAKTRSARAAAPEAPAPAAMPSADTSSQVGSGSVPGNAGSIDSAVSVFGNLSYWYASSGVGLGARYQKTLATRVAISRHPTIHDDMGIEAGVDYFHYSFNVGLGPNWTYNEVAVLGGFVWNFWFNDKLAVYPKVDLGYRFGSWSTNNGFANPGGYGGLAFQGAAGVIYKLGSVALRAEAGSGTLRLGAGFQI